jgi:hypothetical protein
MRVRATFAEAGETSGITYSSRLFVALVIQHGMFISRIILLSKAWSAVTIFSQIIT